MDYLYGIGYSVMIALGSVLVHEAGGGLPIALILFCSCGLAILVFHLLNLTEIKHMYCQLWQAKKLWCQMMVIITLIWICSMYGYYLVHPEIFMLLYFGAIFFFGLITKNLNKLLSKTETMGIFCLSLFSIAFIFVNFIKSQSPLTSLNILGMVLGVLGGIFSFIYLKQSYKLTQLTGLGATQILAIRFWLIFIISFVLLVTMPKAGFVLNSHVLAVLLIIPLFTMIIPLFFTQQSIVKVGPTTTSILIGLVPSFTYLISAVVAHYYQWQVLMCSLLFIGMIALTEFFSWRNQK